MKVIFDQQELGEKGKLGYQKHYRVDHGNNEFVRGKQHINGIKLLEFYKKKTI